MRDMRGHLGCQGDSRLILKIFHDPKILRYPNFQGKGYLGSCRIFSIHRSNGKMEIAIVFTEEYQGNTEKKMEATVVCWGYIEETMKNEN